MSTKHQSHQLSPEQTRAPHGHQQHQSSTQQPVALTSCFKLRSGSVSSTSSHSPKQNRKDRLSQYNRPKRQLSREGLPAVIPNHGAISSRSESDFFNSSSYSNGSFPSTFGANNTTASVSVEKGGALLPSSEQKRLLFKSNSGGVPNMHSNTTLSERSQQTMQTDTTATLSVSDTIASSTTSFGHASSENTPRRGQTAAYEFTFPDNDKMTTQEMDASSRSMNTTSATTRRYYNKNNESVNVVDGVESSKSKEDEEEEVNGPCRRYFPIPNIFKRRKRITSTETTTAATAADSDTNTISEKTTLTIQQVVEQIKKEDLTQNEYLLKMEEQWVGDVGLALFLPFHYYKTTQKKQPVEGVVSESEEESSSESSEEDELMIEEDPDLESSPPILTNEQLQEIHSRGLPPTVSLMMWTRAYSLHRDGDYFGCMMSKVEKYTHTLTVIKTKDGDILGGYADTPWARQKGNGMTRSRSFYGGGKSFLFSIVPDSSHPDENEKEPSALWMDNDLQESETSSILPQHRIRDIQEHEHSSDCSEIRSDYTISTKKGSMNFYRWTGNNSYSQICDVDEGCLGMGGGGAFGWFIQKDFTIGSSGPCETFGNPALTRDKGGHFEIVDVEIYGFKSMMESLAGSSCYSISSQRSVGSTIQSIASRNSSIASTMDMNSITSNRSICSMMT